MKAFGIELDSGTGTVFDDITPETEWIIPYINTAKRLDIISGQLIDGQLFFRPNDTISRAEALKMAFRIAQESLESADILIFQDMDFVPWMIPYVIRAKELSIIHGQWINGRFLFRPNANITRAEASKILVNFLRLR